MTRRAVAPARRQVKPRARRHESEGCRVFGLLRSYRLIHRDRQDVGGGVMSLALESERPVNARAGQHGLLQLGATTMKPFSLASAPGEDHVLIGTSLASESTVQKRRAALQPGDSVVLRGPINDSTLDGVAGPVVLLAQGVGITPFRSMLPHTAREDLAVDSSLIDVANSGHAHRKDTQTWAARASYPPHSDEFRAAVVAVPRAQPDATFHVAGASASVSSTAALLRGSGVAGSNIRQDEHLGHEPATHQVVDGNLDRDTVATAPWHCDRTGDHRGARADPEGARMTTRLMALPSSSATLPGVPMRSQR